MKSFAAAALVGVAAAHPTFEEWAAQFQFNGADDELRAKYNANLAVIDELNAANSGATFAVNQFSGMTFQEFSDMYLTNTEPAAHQIDSSVVPVSFLEEDPLSESVTSIDWVSAGGVTPVKDQASCGSCWAFSTMASVESVHRIGTGKIANLAEQQLVDCNTGNSGCSGGSATSAIQWLVSNPPYTTASYPYRATQGSCKTGTSSGVRVGGVNLVSTSESALQSALGGSPASVSVYADSGWQHYSSGVLDAAVTCGHNHAVLAVGYDSSAWKIKNSWGTGWGESGYIRIAKGKGGCGASGIVTSSPRIPTGVSVEEVV